MLKLKGNSMINNINIEDIKIIAFAAGEAIMKIYAQEIDIAYKEDFSPLTQADMQSNEIICSGLLELYPNIPMLSEENGEVPYETRKDWELNWRSLIISVVSCLSFYLFIFIY